MNILGFKIKYVGMRLWQRVLREGKDFSKIEAIKILRKNDPKMSLRAAKNKVDAYVKRHNKRI